MKQLALQIQNRALSYLRAIFPYAQNAIAQSTQQSSNVPSVMTMVNVQPFVFRRLLTNSTHPFLHCQQQIILFYCDAIETFQTRIARATSPFGRSHSSFAIFTLSLQIFFFIVESMLLHTFAYLFFCFRQLSTTTTAFFTLRLQTRPSIDRFIKFFCFSRDFASRTSLVYYQDFVTFFAFLQQFFPLCALLIHYIGNLSAFFTRIGVPRTSGTRFAKHTNRFQYMTLGARLFGQWMRTTSAFLIRSATSIAPSSASSSVSFISCKFVDRLSCSAFRTLFRFVY